MKYCEKCGTQLNDEAKFCPKCGNPTGSTQADEANSENSSNYCIELISTGPESLQVVKAIKDTLNLSLKEAKDYVDSVPCIMQDGLSLSKAKELAQIIEMSGAKINVKQGYKPIQKDAPSHNEVENNAQEEQSMSKFKKYGLYVLGFLAFFYIVGECSGGSNDSSEKKTEQKQESVKQESAKQEPEEAKESPSFIGTYEVTDKVGCTIRITINEDETATITGVRGEGKTYYCTWSDFSYSKAGLGIEFSSERPLLYFEGGDNAGKGEYCFIKDGWFYPSISTAQANNHDWRLPVKKVN